MTEGLYGISLLTHYIFRVVIPCCQAFCIKEMKLALSMLYVVNRIFPTSNVL